MVVYIASYPPEFAVDVKNSFFRDILLLRLFNSSLHSVKVPPDSQWHLSFKTSDRRTTLIEFVFYLSLRTRILQKNKVIQQRIQV